MDVREGTRVRWFEDVGSGDTHIVGGKNASLGEMVRSLGERGIRVPGGFATTADAYREFVRANGLEEGIRSRVGEFQAGSRPLSEVGREIRELILGGSFPDPIAEAIRGAYRELGRRYGATDVDVAVRSSATAEDLPDASFAGQLESFLNITGEEALLDVCRRCYASLFTDRGMAYREEKGFDHMAVAVSVGVQKMVRSDLSAAGVMFTLDTESGFPDVIVINGAWGLGESTVVLPDDIRFDLPQPRTTRSSNLPDIADTRMDGSVGVKFLAGGARIVANALVPLNDGGMRPSVVWTLGLERLF